LRVRLTILLSLALMVAPVAQAAAAVSGTWSNVRVDDTNGDTHGMRVEVRDGRAVFVTDCEVQCREPVKAEARIDGNRVAFSVRLGQGGVTRFTGEVRGDGRLVLRREGRPWNALILQPDKQEVSREDTLPPLASPAAPCAGRDCIPATLTHLPTTWGGEEAPFVVVPSLAGMDFGVEERKRRPFIHVVAKENAAASRFAGFYSNIVYREGAEATEGMALDYRPDGAPVVTVHDCERYCDHIETVPVTVRGYRIAFTLEQEMGGFPAKGRRYLGEFRADGTLKVWGDGQRGNAQILRPNSKAARENESESLTKVAWQADGFAGVWSSITYLNETDDFFGMRVDVRPGVAPVAIVTDCGGGCSEEMTVPVTLRGTEIAFTLYAGQPYSVGYTGKLRPDGSLLLAVDGNPDASRVLLPEVKE
jgi:hypothetical protein